MQARSLSDNYFNDLKFQIQPGKAQSVVIDFLKCNLPLYLSQHDKKLTGEDDISQAIVIFLETQARQNNSDLLFCFQYKYISSRRSVDIAVVHEGSFKAFFVIEAKRLPPANTKDYVQGKTGGIERFKKGHHGQGLFVSAMLGYVQKKGFEYWHSNVNSWIDNLTPNSNDAITWCGKDRLRKVESSEDMGLYTSTHSRPEQKSISLYHFWLNMVNNE
ncbi:MAG: hypothetical protein ACC651_13690 [Candidatus Scalindua sp.]